MKLVIGKTLVFGGIMTSFNDIFDLYISKNFRVGSRVIIGRAKRSDPSQIHFGEVLVFVLAVEDVCGRGELSQVGHWAFLKPEDFEGPAWERVKSLEFPLVPNACPNPLCGNKDIVVEKSEWPLIFVCCRDCGLRGPTSCGHDAVNHWNSIRFEKNS